MSTLVQCQRGDVYPYQTYCWSSGEIETWYVEVITWGGEGDTGSGDSYTWSAEVDTWSGEVSTWWSVKVVTSVIVPSMNELILKKWGWNKWERIK